MHFRPDGAQGVKIGVKVSGEKEYEALDKAIGELDPAARNTAGGIRKAIASAGLSEVES